MVALKAIMDFSSLKNEGNFIGKDTRASYKKKNLNIISIQDNSYDPDR
ncbi:MAG: hypothetical protein C5S40_02300 [ANME-2 cluster archaeon]|nr:hypothetical protein [ANME-2 cluster archaeon]